MLFILINSSKYNYAYSHMIYERKHGFAVFVDLLSAQNCMERPELGCYFSNRFLELLFLWNWNSDNRY